MKKSVCLLFSLVVIMIIYFYKKTVLNKHPHLIQDRPQIEKQEEKKETNNQRTVASKRTTISPQRHPISKLQDFIRKFHDLPLEEFNELKEISDSENQYLLSKTFVAVHRNTDDTDSFIPPIGTYSIIEKNDSLKQGNTLMVAYDKRNLQMGVITGTILVKVPEKDNFQTALSHLQQDKSFSVGNVFFEIGYIQLKVLENNKTIMIVQKLMDENRFKNVTMEVFTGGVRAY